MGANVASIINTVRYTVKDIEGVLWSDSIILDAIADAEKTIVHLDASATAVTSVFTCDAGFDQVLSMDHLPANSPVPVRLLDVRYNIVAGVPNTGVKRVGLLDLDAFLPQWRAAPLTIRASDFMLDERNPTRFYLYPPVIAGTQLSIIYSSVPAEYPEDITGVETTVDEMYRPMLLNYVLYKLFGHDVEGSVNAARSRQHLETFYSMMDTKLKGEMAVSPRNTGHKR